MAGIARGRVAVFVLVFAALLIALGGKTLMPTVAGASSNRAIASIPVDVPANAAPKALSGPTTDAPDTANAGESTWLWVALGVGIGGLAAGLAGLVLALGERPETLVAEVRLPEPPALT